MHTASLAEIKLIKAAEIFSDPCGWDLILEYSVESSIRAIGPINPQPAMYAAMEQMGMLQCFGAYDGTELVGFATVLTTILPHYGRKVATMESLFVARNHRKGGTGTELARAVEAYAKEQGCAALLISAPAAGKLEKVLEHSKGFERTNAVFAKQL